MINDKIIAEISYACIISDGKEVEILEYSHRSVDLCYKILKGVSNKSEYVFFHKSSVLPMWF